MILSAVRVAIVGALTIGSMFGAVSIAHADPSPAAYCAPTVVLAVDGTKGPETPDSIDPDSPLNSYTDQYRDSSDFAVRHVRYPAGMVAGGFGWDTFMDQSVQIGVQNLWAEIGRTEAACGPRTRYELYGYSQGAIVVRRVAMEIDAVPPVHDDGTDLQDRVRVHLIADPAQGRPAQYAGPLVPGITLPQPAGELRHIPVTTECLEGDMICDPEGNVSGYIREHATYHP
ncbi:cutinase family protein [Rhodococcus ruber]|uniref:cutinase family protein n=1 Tax=Rhodococcus ruber TaxID=1830 RepID=UPI000F51E445|nr:cutinase family protein [Rhodococcus ruber]RQM35940.1 hypothetical protein TN91_01485 [Rhodococcus ruber]